MSIDLRQQAAGRLQGVGRAEGRKLLYETLYKSRGLDPGSCCSRVVIVVVVVVGHSSRSRQEVSQRQSES